jgi:hypothetical protein
VFFNYARYQSVLPLDAAIRQLGNELDDTSYFFSPMKDGSGNMLRDANGAPILDTAAALNGTSKNSTTSFGKPSFASSTGEGIIPGTRMEYENEFVLGVQREVVPGSTLGVRYTDRRLGRIVEDIGSQSPEGSLIDGNYAGGIANVSASTDDFNNESEVTYTPADWAAANGTNSPGFFSDAANAALYKPPVPGCTLYTVTDSKGNVSVATGDTSVANGDFFRKYDGSPYNGSCVTNFDSNAGAYGKDGKSDGFANPSRLYKEVVVEFARNTKNNWQARINYRWAKLYGNYEGFFRNDNGQSDPGISSLFDFTNGSLGLLGDQTTPGLLNTDRRNVLNADISYVVNEKTPFISAAKGLNIGVNARSMSGTPLSAYASHPIYLNTGEVPIGGRGKKGTLPWRQQLDLHADYSVKLHQIYTMKFAFDAFNVFNSKITSGKTQNLDTAPGSPNPDYGKISAYQAPFFARMSAKFEF